MRVALCSDLHLEFGELELKNTGKAEVLILSGDICVAQNLMIEGAAKAHKSELYHDFFKQVCSEFPHVIYIMGNHEHYNGDFATTYGILKERLGYLKNLHILDKETFRIGEVTFIGGTLWTDMNGEDPSTMFTIKSMMNDFRIIQNSNKMHTRKVTHYKRDGNNEFELDEKGRPIEIGMKMKEYPSLFSPQDAVEYFKTMLHYIDHVIKNNPDDKFVIVGHHAPSRKSTHPRYEMDVLMNGGYSSHLEFFIEEHPQIKLWTHGHTHDTFDYKIGETRVVCNPRGYIGYEKRAEDFKLLFLDV
jgi:Icc-related predicted phosphoesterase